MKSASSDVSESISGAFVATWCFPKYLSWACCTAGVSTICMNFAAIALFFQERFLPVPAEGCRSASRRTSFSPFECCSKRTESQLRFPAHGSPTRNVPCRKRPPSQKDCPGDTLPLPGGERRGRSFPRRQGSEGA